MNAPLSSRAGSGAVPFAAAEVLLRSLATAVPPHRLDQDRVRAAAKAYLSTRTGLFDHLEPVFTNAEIETRYASRPEGSHSKLSTFRDGWRILNTIVTLYRIERPVLFFGGIGALLLLVAILLAIPLVLTYLQTGLVPRFPTAILVTGMTVTAVLCFFTGLILDTVTRGRREMRRLAYLGLHAPGAV